MAYCRDCGCSISSRQTYCGSCESGIINRAKNRVNKATENERRRLSKDQDYAHDWLQGNIGWIVSLMGIISKIFSGGCYITTAVVKHKGLDDSSEEMEIMRDFRQKYVLESHNSDLKNELCEYYILGQIIVNWVNSRSDSYAVWEYISEYVFDFISLIQNDKYDDAYTMFKNRTLNIKKDVLAMNHIKS